MGDTSAARPANDRDDVREDPFDEILPAMFALEELTDLDDERLDHLLMEAIAAQVRVPEKCRHRAITAAEAVLLYDEDHEEPTPSARTRPTLRPAPAPPDSA